MQILKEIKYMYLEKDSREHQHVILRDTGQRRTKGNFIFNLSRKLHCNHISKLSDAENSSGEGVPHGRKT